MKAPTPRRWRITILRWVAVSLSVAHAQAAPDLACPPPADAPETGHTATLLPNGKVLVAGGVSRTSGTGDHGCACDVFGKFAHAWLYDPATNAWSLAAPMAQARTAFTATLLPSGKTLVSGGSSATAELYDPAANTWSPAAPLAIGRRDHSAVLLLSGQVLVAGGGPLDGASAKAIPAELYDPATNQWTRVGATKVARSWHTMTLLPSGKVLAAGSYTSGGRSMLFNPDDPESDASDPKDPSAMAELYDPATRTWSTTGSMKLGRYRATATLLPSGKVLLVGGGTQSRGETTRAELFAPLTGTWEPASPLRVVPRDGHTAVLLPTGHVLVAGGTVTPRFTSASAELYDPKTNRWSSANQMTLGRTGHTATLLPNGKVLVVGGIRDNRAATAAELYDPASNTWSLTGPMAVPKRTATAERPDACRRPG